MLCMKCGKKTDSGRVFCDSCLSEMEKYPVKPDIRVQLPSRPTAEKKPLVKKLPVSPEQVISQLRRQVKGLTVALVCSALALSLTIGLLFYTANQAHPEDTVGKNYSTADTERQP